MEALCDNAPPPCKLAMTLTLMQCNIVNVLIRSQLYKLATSFVDHRISIETFGKKRGKRIIVRFLYCNSL